MNTFSTIQWETGHAVDFASVNGAARQVLKWMDDQFTLGEPARIVADCSDEDSRAGLTCVRPIFAKVGDRFAGVVLEYGENPILCGPQDSYYEPRGELESQAPQPVEQDLDQHFDSRGIENFFESLRLPRMVGKPSGISAETYFPVIGGRASDETLKVVFEAWVRENKICADLEESWKIVRTRYSRTHRR